MCLRTGHTNRGRGLERAEGRALPHDAGLLRGISNANPTAVFYKDMEEKYLGCNQTFTEMMGVTSEAMIGKTVFELWPGEHAEMYHKKDLQLMQNPEHQIYEFVIQDKDKNIRPVIYAKDKFFDEHGNLAGIVGAFLDISDSKKAEEDLLSAKDHLIHAKDGEEAVEICLANQDIEMVLMDIRMPKMDGYEAAEIIKSKKPKLPIIAQTAFTTEEVKKMALERGCDDLISKPLDNEKFYMLV